MKKIPIITLLLLSHFCYGQTKNQDFYNLVRIAEIYSDNSDEGGKDFKNTLEEFRTPNLNHIIDALIAVGKGDKKLLTKEFLSKPGEQELKYWYVICEIHYNNQSKDKEPRPNNVVAQEVLNQKIDERWLLDNYYYRVRGGIAKIFNTENLSSYNISLDEYGLTTETEKAIFFLALTNALTQRLIILHMLKNYDKLLEFAKKLPTFNGKPYYEYTAFSFNDFDWIGYDKTESYKKINIGSLYTALNGHFNVLAERGKNDKMFDLYYKSILFIPEYFQYSNGMENSLQKLYEKSKK